MLPPGVVVEEDDLLVLFALYDLPEGAVAWRFAFGVHIDNLAVPLVSKEKSLVRLRVYFKVRGHVEGSFARGPAIPGEVRFLGHERFLFVKDGAEVLLLHAVGQVDVRGHFVFDLVVGAVLDITDEKDGGLAAVAETLLTLGQGVQEVVVLNLAAFLGERFHLQLPLILHSFDDC